MDKITKEELDALKIDDLVSRMDEFLISDFQQKMTSRISKLNVQSLYQTKAVREFPVKFQRAVIYKAFQFFLQLQYTSLSNSAHFHRFPEINSITAKQLNFAARNQWCAVSSRMAFEYFMHLTYMLESGKVLSTSQSVVKPYKKWLKKPDNPYSYFALIAAQAKYFNSTRRTPEVHAGTKYAKKILLMSADDTIDSTKNCYLYTTLLGQWQHVLKIADGHDPNGWSSVGGDSGSQKWHELYKSKNRDTINNEIERMFSENPNDELIGELFLSI